MLVEEARLKDIHVPLGVPFHQQPTKLAGLNSALNCILQLAVLLRRQVQIGFQRCFGQSQRLVLALQLLNERKRERHQRVMKKKG